MLDKECAEKAPATRNQYLSATSMLFKYAMERDWCDSNPATLVSRLSEKGNERDRVITPTEEQALQDAFDKQGQYGAKTAPVDGSKIFRNYQPEPLAWWTPHYCRHTWATRVAALPGMNVQQLCSLAGWGGWQMAERYSHLMDIGSADLME